MLFIESKQGDLFGIRDTDDNTLEYLSVSDIKKAVSARLKIYGVSNAGIEVVSFKEVLKCVKSKYLLLGDEEGFNKLEKSFCMNFANYEDGGYFYKVADEGFRLCRCLKAIEIPDTVIEIGYRAFLGCDKLQSVTIPDSVTEIGEDVFRFCNSLQSVSIPRHLSGCRSKLGCSPVKVKVKVRA